MRRAALGLLWLVISGALLTGAAGPGTDAWKGATELGPDGTPARRFIPVELWTGEAWDGRRDLVMRKVSLSHKPAIPWNHPLIAIEGPFPWEKDPGVQLFRRSRISSRTGPVVQLFRINEAKDGLGRVLDERGGKVRGRDEASKFPLGWWRRGEARAYNDSQQTRITIEELDYTFLGAAHSLRFRWTVKHEDTSYVFSPGKGLVALYHHSR